MRSYKCCSPTASESMQVSSLASILKIVTEESRLKILCVLRQSDHCVCEIAENINLSPSLISHHLKDLKDAGLVIDRKDSKWVYYSLTPKGKDITKLIFKIKK